MKNDPNFGGASSSRVKKSVANISLPEVPFFNQQVAKNVSQKNGS